MARGEDSAESDPDLLVHLPKGAGMFALGRFRQELEDLLHVDVDVVPDEGVKSRIGTNIARDLVAL